MTKIWSKITFLNLLNTWTLLICFKNIKTNVFSNVAEFRVWQCGKADRRKSSLGFCGLISVSANNSVIPDLAFFSLLLKDKVWSLSIIIILLYISLTVSSIDTLINAISSLIVVDGNKILKFNGDYLKLSKYFIIFLSLIAFYIASKGFSILYLFLLADLFCCSAVLTVFSSFYNKSIKEKNSYISIIFGLVIGLMLFPSPDFTKSILIGILLPHNIFPTFVSQSLLFLSFFLATISPMLTWKIK